MTLRCPACQQAYPMDARRLPAEGIRLRCDRCSSVFFAYPDGTTRAQLETAPARAPLHTGPFFIRSPEDGSLWRCPDRTTLITWHQEGRVLDTDEVSTDSERWSTLSAIPGILAATAPTASSPGSDTSARAPQQTAALATVPPSHASPPPDESRREAAQPQASQARAPQPTAGLMPVEAPQPRPGTPDPSASRGAPIPPGAGSSPSSVVSSTFSLSPSDRAQAAVAAQNPPSTSDPSPEAIPPAHERAKTSRDRASSPATRNETPAAAQPSILTTPPRVEERPAPSRPREVTRDVEPVVAPDAELDPAFDDWPRETGRPQKIALVVVLLLVLAATGFIFFFGTPLGRTPSAPPTETTDAETRASATLPADEAPVEEPAAPESAEDTEAPVPDEGADTDAPEPTPAQPPAPTTTRQARTAPPTPAPQPTRAPASREAPPRTAPAVDEASTAGATSSVDALLTEGQRALEARQWREALRAFNSARSAAPQRPEAVVGEARALLGMGRVDAAGVTLERFLADGVRYAPAWLLLGDIRVQQSRVDEARAHYEHVIVLAPRGSSANRARAALERLP